MSDRTDTIHSLQRAARSQGRRDASLRVDEPRGSRRELAVGDLAVGDLLRRGALAARDWAHYHALRGAELFSAMPRRTRRIAAGSGAAAVLLVVVVSAIAGAEDDPRRTGNAAGDGARAAASDVAAHAARGTHADETLIGTTGADRINGRAGDDVMLGGAGADVLGGATGNDVLHGAGGDDILFAGPGRDVLIGAAGDDQLRATNFDGARDRLHCGAGNDIAWVVARGGRVEDITTGCERVNVIDVRAARRAR